MKSQDTKPALEALAAAGVTDQPIVCAQNGVDNEREALRFFPNVYAMMVVMPATFVRPGEVVAFGGPRAGIFDIGRYPSGADATTGRICAALERAGFAAFPTADAMQSKYGKLIMNLGNVLDAAAGEAAFRSDLGDAARTEARIVLGAAGITLSAAGGADDERRQQLMQMQPVAGAERVGSSSAQSLARGTGSIETEYLNGEIVLLGRLHGVPTPVNEGLVRLGRHLIAEKSKPGSLNLDEVARIARS
jgi:2-dehydropantoate 2-reductase